jgi:RNA polymerase sigma-70 factor (ECF subfamily)
MNLDLDLYWQEIQKNNEAALGKVFRIVFKPLVYYATEITGQHHLAEEIVQDVMMKVWEKRFEISIKDSFKAYLFSAVHNKSINALRELNTRKASVNQACSEKMMEFLSETCCSDDNFIDRIFSEETELIIEVTIGELPSQCKEVFCKSRFDKMTNAEIANILGISENTVKTHIYRALQKISIALEKKK